MIKKVATTFIIFTKLKYPIAVATLILVSFFLGYLHNKRDYCEKIYFYKFYKKKYSKFVSDNKKSNYRCAEKKKDENI